MEITEAYISVHDTETSIQECQIKYTHKQAIRYSLELETALATALDDASSLLIPQLVRNPSAPSLFHSDFDNFDQFVRDLSGSGSVHTAHGIMLQNVTRSAQAESVPNQPAVHSGERTGVRSLKSFGDESLPPCCITQRDSPVMNIHCSCHTAYL